MDHLIIFAGKKPQECEKCSNDQVCTSTSYNGIQDGSGKQITPFIYDCKNNKKTSTDSDSGDSNYKDKVDHEENTNEVEKIITNNDNEGKKVT